MKKKIFVGFVLFILLSTYELKNDFNIFKIFNIKKIEIKNNEILDSNAIRNDLNFLYKKNIFSLNEKEIKEKIEKNNFIESFEIKKIYPSSIKIKIFEKKPIAILHYKKEKFFYTDKGDVIKYSNIEKFDSLPIVFSNRDNFNFFYKKLVKINFPIDQIKSLYFFEINRWDLITINNKIIKLPINNYEKSLKSFLRINVKDNFTKFKVFDYRINGQLILK
tara:strand:- start:1080 stop:1739 length:660 start_codon:yes stop_codon:yes gene_type:complete